MNKIVVLNKNSKNYEALKKNFTSAGFIVGDDKPIPNSKPNGWEDKLDRQSMAIVDGFMTVLGWDKYMTVKERQSVNDGLDSYVKGVLSQAILSAEETLLREIMEEMPKGDIATSLEPREIAWSKGWNDYHDQVNTILERKLSTVKKI